MPKLCEKSFIDPSDLINYIKMYWREKCTFVGNVAKYLNMQKILGSIKKLTKKRNFLLVNILEKPSSVSVIITVMKAVTEDRWHTSRHCRKTSASSNY